jgi:hypothetical protein
MAQHGRGDSVESHLIQSGEVILEGKSTSAALTLFISTRCPPDCVVRKAATPEGQAKPRSSACDAKKKDNDGHRQPKTKKGHCASSTLFSFLAGSAGLEPATSGFVDRCSIQLSYEPVVATMAEREGFEPSVGF